MKERKRSNLQSAFSIERIVDVRGCQSRETSYCISSCGHSSHKNFLAAHHKKSSFKAHMLSALLDSNLLLSILRLL